MMVQTRQSQRRSHDASHKVCANWSGPMPGSDKSASGTSSTCHRSRTGTATRVAGTDDHLTRPDSENNSEPPEQVYGPHDQPELKTKRRQWSHNQNKEVMYCYYMAIKDKPRGSRKRMHQLWIERQNFECTEKQLCDQKKQIIDKNLLTAVEIDEVKQEVDNKTRQEHHDQETEEEQIPPDPDIPVEPIPQIAETPETTTQIDLNNLIDDNNDEYNELKDDYVDLLGKVKAQPLEARQKLPKLKNDKRLKRMINILDKVVEETSQDNMDLTTINQKQYTAALVITNKILPPKPQYKKTQRGRPPAWQQRLQRQIDQLRGEISIITEYQKGNSTNKTRRKLRKILKKHKVASEDQLTACKEDLKQALQSKAQRLRRYIKRSEQYKENKRFRDDTKRFYRELGKKTIQIETPPDIAEVKKFWQNILEQEVKHNEDAQWIKDQEEQLQINQMEWNDIKVEELQVNMTRAANRKSPGPDKLPNFWIKQFKSLHKPMAIAYSVVINDPQQIPEWLVEGITNLLPKKEETWIPKNYRPIACLPTTFKILTSVITDRLYNHLENESIMTPEQRGGKKDCYGCKDQLMINNAILENCKAKKKNVSTAWIDYKKAFDSVPHSWIVRCLQMYKIHPVLIKFIEQSMNHWKTNMTLVHKEGVLETGPIRIKRGIFQG